MTVPFAILVGLFFMNTLLVFTNIRFLKQISDVSDWIIEKQTDLLKVGGADSVLETIQETLYRMGEWALQSKNIIIPGILLTQLCTAYMISSINGQETLSAVFVNFIALAQAGVIVSAFVLIQRMMESLKMIHHVNDEVIKITVMREAEKIEKEGDTGEE